MEDMFHDKKNFPDTFTAFLLHLVQHKETDWLTNQPNYMDQSFFRS